MPSPTSLRSLVGLGVLVALAAGGTQWLQSWSRDRLAQQVASQARPGDIHMVSSLTCVYCTRARAWFTAHGVPFSECFIERDADCAAVYQALLAPGTPVFIVRGRRLVGFSEATLAAALEVRPSVQ